LFVCNRGNMMIKLPKTITSPEKTRPRAAFSLVELTVGVSLVSLLVVAVGLSTFRSRAHTAATRTAFTATHRKHDLLRTIAQDLSCATQIAHLADDRISFARPSRTVPAAFETVDYRWDIINKEVSVKPPASPLVVIASDIYDMSIEADLFSEQSKTYIHGMTITIQFGPGPADTAQRSIVFLNAPQVLYVDYDDG